MAGITILPAQSLNSLQNQQYTQLLDAMLSRGWGGGQSSSVPKGFGDSLGQIASALFQARPMTGPGVDTGGPQIPWNNPYGYSSGI